MLKLQLISQELDAVGSFTHAMTNAFATKSTLANSYRMGQRSPVTRVCATMMFSMLESI